MAPLHLPQRRRTTCSVVTPVAEYATDPAHHRDFLLVAGNTYRRLADGLRAPDRLPLRCHYCDTAYAFSGGDVVSLDAILERVAAYKPRYICVTGGEPLAQPNCISLLERLCDAGYEVSLETSGASMCHGSTRA